MTRICGKKITKWLHLFAFVGLGLPTVVVAQAVYENYTFLTLAGPSEPGVGWHDGTGSVARFNLPFGVAVDGSGNVYVADTTNYTIRKITAAGAVTTLAGTAGSPGTNDGIGGAARFGSPSSLAVDGSGNVYVADTASHTIRKVTPAGAVSTFAGLAGRFGTSDGTGAAARFRQPFGVAVDGSGNVYVADTFNFTIRKITPSGTVATLAGRGGYAGTNDATGSAARFYYPCGVVVAGDGTVYVADTGACTIRKITPAGAVTTLAGLAGYYGANNGTGSAANFYYPYGITFSGGNVYVADTFNQTVRKVTPAGVVTTFAGSAGSSGSADGTSGASFSYPYGIASDSSGNLYVADSYNYAIRKVTSAGATTTLAGQPSGLGSADGAGSAARLNYPAAVAMGGDGSVYVADHNNHSIRKIAADGAVTTLAGLSGTYGTNDGTGTAARFFNPSGLVVDGSGNVYVADAYNHAIRKVTPGGVVTTVAGLVGTAGTNDGTGSAARFSYPFGVTTDGSNLYVGDTWNHTVRKVSPAGVVTTVAGLAGAAGSSDGAGAAARFNYPEGVAVDGSGNLYVADDGNHTIRKITPVGVVTTLAGKAGVWGSVDGMGGAAHLSFPYGLAVDGSGNLYVGDVGNHAIRKVTPAGAVTTLAGTLGSAGSADGTGSKAGFNSPEGVAVDAAGNVYVADAANHSIRKGYRALPDKPFVDRPAGGVGVARHLDVANATTTSWSWTFLRRPAGSSAQLSSSTARNPAFTPDVADLYVLRFEGRDSQGRVATGTVSIWADSPDATLPTLTITSPKSGQRWSNVVYEVKGKASDSRLAGVWCRVGNGAWEQAEGASSWSASVSMTPGTNLVQAYAMDAYGNCSLTSSVKLVYVQSDRLTVNIAGSGSISPNYANAVLELGKTYKLTATPKTGYIFSNWVSSVGVVLTNTPVLSFQMQSNLALQANFITNPFVASGAKGTYAGLFYTEANGANHTNSGLFKASVSTLGSFSSSWKLGPTTYSLAGQFAPGGYFSKSIPRAGKTPLTVQMQLDLWGRDTVTGSISDGDWTAELKANRLVYSTVARAPQGGKKYTLMLQGGSEPALEPGGCSYGTVSVSTSGTITFAGVMGDGTPVSQSAFVSKQGQWPFYASLYSGKGSVLGWLTFTNAPDRDIEGRWVRWVKPAQSTATLYRSGFTCTNAAVGSFYTNRAPLLSLTNGAVVMLEGGNLASSLISPASFGASKLTGANKLSLLITTTSGLFSGSLTNPANGKTLTLKGAVVQKQNAGYGFFRGTNQTGSVYFGEPLD